MDIAKIRKKIKEGEREKNQAGKDLARKESPDMPAPQEQEAPGAMEKPVESSPMQPLKRASEEIIIENEPREIIPETPRKETAKETAAIGPQTEAIKTDIVELLTFQLSSEEFALRVSDIEEIIRLQGITPVPKVPDYILGITSLRGKTIPVMDLKKRLSIKGKESIDGQRRKILILKGAKGPIGTLIDKIRGVIRISPSEIVEPPANLAEAELLFAEGVVLHDSKFITVINKDEVLAINLKSKERI